MADHRYAPPMDWEGAPCAGKPTSWFFPTANDYGAAKKLCKDCPLRDACLQYALDNNIFHGMWGGTTERQRTRMRRGDGAPTLPAGRPPKAHGFTGEKFCPSCEETKPAAEFGARSTNGIPKLQSWCRICMRVAHRKRRAALPDRIHFEA